MPSSWTRARYLETRRLLKCANENFVGLQIDPAVHGGARAERIVQIQRTIHLHWKGHDKGGVTQLRPLPLVMALFSSCFALCCQVPRHCMLAVFLPGHTAQLFERAGRARMRLSRIAVGNEQIGGCGGGKGTALPPSLVRTGESEATQQLWLVGQRRDDTETLESDDRQ